MDTRFGCRSDHAYDIPVGESFVRLWSAEGPRDRARIRTLFEPLVRTGFIHPYIVLMPDWHPGEDAVVGSVVPTRATLLPNVIGCDIGCGMTAVRLPVPASEIGPALPEIAAKLRAVIPVGPARNAEVTRRVVDNRIWRNEPRARVSSRVLRTLVRQFASLGGGNHFLEIQKDDDDFVWIMLHSGSRRLGAQVRDWYVTEGAKLAGIDGRLYARVPHLPAGSPLGLEYLDDVRAACEFARASRREMTVRALEVIDDTVSALDVSALVDGAVDVGHNFVEEEEHFGQRLWVHRKGAIRLRKGETGCVPGSMGTSSYVVEGRGNEHGFCSCAHGAGRAMSRSAALRTVTERAFRESMKGVFCEHDALLLDEAPSAYKDIRTVMRGQGDLVKILLELKPLMSLKGR